MRHLFTVKLLILAAIASAPAFAGEYVVLSTGFRLYAERHETVDGRVLLHTKGGTVEFPIQEVDRFEIEEYVPAPKPEQPAAASWLPVQEVLSPREIVHKAAEKHGLPATLIESVARAESGLQANAVSPKGAIGLMQLMPGTAAELNADPHDPHQNADAGVRYLRDLLIKYLDHPYQVEMALAAYNAGPGAVDKYNGIPPYRETQNYVRRVIDTKRKLER